MAIPDKPYRSSYSWDLLVVNVGSDVGENMPNSIDYDESFIYDKLNDREYESEPTARDIILSCLTDALLETTCMLREDCKLMAEQLLSRIEPYICYEGK